MTILTLPQTRLNIAFFGTPEIAASVLQDLIEADSDTIKVVICQPDKKVGRKQKLTAPATKILAQKHNIPVFQPVKMKDGSLAKAMSDYEIDLAIVIAYGRILTRDTLDSTRFGFWNLHTSILPKFRGASPIHHALLSGEERTGVSLMQMTEGCDEGPVMEIATVDISTRETLSSLTRKLVGQAGKLIVTSLYQAKRDGLEVQEQDHSAATHAQLLSKSDGRIDFAKRSIDIDRQVRALNPWPGTYVALQDNQNLKVHEAQPCADNSQAETATVLETESTLKIKTSEGAIELLSVQPPGKKRMLTSEYLRGAGRHWKVGMRFGV